MRNLPSDAGSKGVFKASLEKVRLAAQDSTGELGFKIKEQTDTSYIASQGMTGSTSGRYVRVRVTTVESGEVHVFVAVRSKAESRDAAHTDDLIEKDILKRITGRLAAK